MASGLAIYSMAPFFYGIVDTNIGCILWMLCALPFVIIAVIGCFMNGDVAGGAANAVLIHQATGHQLLPYIIASNIDMEDQKWNM